MDEEFDVNAEWTLKSIEERKKEGKYRTDVCYDCSKKNVQVKTYLVAVANRKLAWQDGDGAVYEKLRVQYCDDCVDKLVSTLKEEPAIK